MIRSTSLLLMELVVLFIGVSFLVDISQRRVGADRLRMWMGGRPSMAALKGIAVGFVTPFCTYSAIPVVTGLRRAGVAPAGYVAFISAAPVLDPILFGALWLIAGFEVAVLYLGVSFVAALVLALVVDRVGIERHLRPVEVMAAVGVAVRTAFGEPASDLSDPDAPPWRGWRVESKQSGLVGVRSLRSFGPLLLVGVAVGVAIEWLVPPSAAARLTTGRPLMAIPAAAAIGAPLYFNTELFVPIANSLQQAGVGIGAIVALTVSGAGASIPEFIVLSRIARPGALAVFASYVFGVAIVGGCLAHLLVG